MSLEHYRNVIWWLFPRPVSNHLIIAQSYYFIRVIAWSYWKLLDCWELGSMDMANCLLCPCHMRTRHRIFLGHGYTRVPAVFYFMYFLNNRIRPGYFQDTTEILLGHACQKKRPSPSQIFFLFFFFVFVFVFFFSLRKDWMPDLNSYVPLLPFCFMTFVHVCLG